MCDCKERKREYQHAYKLVNKERIRKYKQKYFQKNKAKIYAYKKERRDRALRQKIKVIIVDASCKDLLLNFD